MQSWWFSYKKKPFFSLFTSDYYKNSREGYKYRYISSLFLQLKNTNQLRTPYARWSTNLLSPFWVLPSHWIVLGCRLHRTHEGSTTSGCRQLGKSSGTITAPPLCYFLLALLRAGPTGWPVTAGWTFAGPGSTFWDGPGGLTEPGMAGDDTPCLTCWSWSSLCPGWEQCQASAHLWTQNFLPSPPQRLMYLGVRLLFLLQISKNKK